MARVAIIGGSGHVGSYLLPRLVGLGHEVINVSRGTARPYRADRSWDAVRHVQADRVAEDRAGTFGARVAALEADVVIDMIAFDLASTRAVVEALRGRVGHYIFCSTIWVYGALTAVPSTEADPPNPIDAYGRGKAESEAFLMREARVSGFPATCFRPGHIVGEGWVPTSPLGVNEAEVFSRIARGEVLTLPNLGLETLHHVHADDLAQWIICAMEHRAASVGEVFNAVSAQAVTLRGYAEAVYGWFGHAPKLEFQPVGEWLAAMPAEMAEDSWGHVRRSSSHSIGKSVQRLGYRPRYTSLEAIRQSVMALVADGRVTES